MGLGPRDDGLKGSLRSKILLLCLGIVVAVTLVFTAIGITELFLLRQAIGKSSRAQNEVLKEESESSVWLELDYEVRLKSIYAANQTDSEFWTLEHDFDILVSQVAEVFSHPERYQEQVVQPPLKENEGKYSLQLLLADRAEASDEKSLSMAGKLANLSPMMEKIIVGNDSFTTDCYIALPSGITLVMDNTPAEKIKADGTADAYDATQREWYQGAVSTKKPYYSSVVNSYFHDTTGIGSGFPVYVDGELVAVLHGFTRLDTLQKTVSEIDEYCILVSDEGQLLYSPNTTGDLAMDGNLSKDIRETSNPELKALIDEALLLKVGYSTATIDGTPYYAYYCTIRTLGWLQIMFVPKADIDDVTGSLLEKMDEAQEEALESYAANFRGAAVATLASMAALIIAAILLATAFSKRLVTPVNRMTKRVKSMTGDDMDFEMESVYKTGDEIEVLAGSFSALTDKLKNYIKEVTAMSAEKERIGIEMATASKIQSSMLPGKFPAFPERNEFDLYAAMEPAKEVGGDLYDYYFIDDDHLALVIGDVSGKGITAALFMVMVKHVIQSQILLNAGDVEKTLESVNALLMEENAAKMFVTIWLGVLTVSTGHLVYANAGHEYPIICRNGQSFELFKDNHGIPLACKKKIKVKLNELELHPGDVLYLYTDGFTEATDENMQMFGHERLLEALNNNTGAGMKELDEAARKAAYEFIGNAEQFDDMTSLCFRYLGNSMENGKAETTDRLDIAAAMDNLPVVSDFVEQKLQGLKTTQKELSQILLVTEELFVNIASYAYSPGTGMASLITKIDEKENSIEIAFIDSGVRYNPLENNDPDITLSAKKRQRGGLGVFLVKRKVDSMTYAYEDGKNVVRIKKNFSKT